MSYDKINHALISRISPKINPTLKQGYSSVCTSAKNIVLPATAIGAVVDVANSVFTGCTPFSYTTDIGLTTYTIAVRAGEINKLVLDNGTILIPTPNGFKDVSGNDNHSTSTTMTMTHLSDSSVFYLEEYGFATDAVNNCYPILVDRSGYAGLDPVSVVKTYPRGLISRKGSIDIEAWNLLDTLIDFGNSTAVKATGLRISEMDGVDCNLELIYVAEPKLDPAEIAVLVPSTGDKFKLDTNFTVSGTSNCANVKIEASANGVDWTVLSASTAVSAGAFSKTDCQLASATFAPNDVINIKVSDVDSVSAPDSVIIGTIATVTLTAIDSITATVAKTIGGFTNGASVNIYYKLHLAGSWTLSGVGTVDEEVGTWTYSLTIPTADTYDIKVTDGTDADAYDQQDSIVVAANQNDGQYMYEGPNTGVYQSKISADYGVNFSNNGAVGTVNSIAVLANGDWAYMACSGIVAKVTKAGAVSTLLSDGTIAFSSIQCSDNGQYAIVNRGVTGVYFTTDYGANWTLREDGINVSSVFCSASGAKMGYFVYGGKATFSNDYGANWATYGNNSNWITGCCCISWDASIIYSGINANDSVMKYTNNGDTIAKLTIDGRTWNAIACSKDGAIVITGASGVAWKAASANYGVTWNIGTAVYGLYMPSASKILVSGNGTKMMYCNAGDGKWYKSVFTPNGYPSEVTPAGQTAVASGDMTTDGKYIIVGTSANIYTSQDFGANWTAISTTNIKSVALNNKRT